MIRKEPLFGRTLRELLNLVSESGLPSFHGRQIAEWLYKRSACSIEEMTDLPKSARSVLKERYGMGIQGPVNVMVSADGTKKYLFPDESGRFIETAYIPESTRATLCMSSQVGCRMNCIFCMTTFLTTFCRLLSMIEEAL